MGSYSSLGRVSKLTLTGSPYHNLAEPSNYITLVCGHKPLMKKVELFELDLLLDSECILFLESGQIAHCHQHRLVTKVTL